MLIHNSDGSFFFYRDEVEAALFTLRRTHETQEKILFKQGNTIDVMEP